MIEQKIEMPLRQRVEYMKRGLADLRRMAPGMIWTLIVSRLFKAVEPFLPLYFSARLVDELLGQRRPEQLWLWGGLAVGLALAVSLLCHVFEEMYNVRQQQVWTEERRWIGAFAVETDYEHLEDPVFQNKVRDYDGMRNMGGAIARRILVSMVDAVQGVLILILAAVLAAGVFFRGVSLGGSGMASPVWSILMVLLILGAGAVSFVVQWRASQKYITYMNGFVEANRYFFYFMSLIRDYKRGKELRIYNGGELMKEINEWWKNVGEDQNGEWLPDSIGRISGRSNSITAALSSALSGLAYLFVALKALAGMFSAGAVIQSVGAVNQFTQGFIQVAQNVSFLYNQTAYLTYLYDVLDTPPVKHKGTLPTEKRSDNEYELEFCSVSFRYPGASDYALRDFSLKLHIGERLAVVGMNGSGKTTMIKLLCRLYDPTEGEILLNGIDIKKYDYDEYQRIFSVVFQDFKLFAFPLGQNVAASASVDREKAEHCLREAGFGKRLDSLEKGLDTPLYRIFEEDGVEISGGEAQKIALARALYKDAPFIILDEPTAALDPVAEYEIYSRFNGIVGTKTAIYISHRLSSCRFCDDIAVFHEGKLVQRGSHEQLLAEEGGKYRELWQAQAQYYEEEQERKEVEKFL